VKSKNDLCPKLFTPGEKLTAIGQLKKEGFFEIQAHTPPEKSIGGLHKKNLISIK